MAAWQPPRFAPDRTGVKRCGWPQPDSDPVPAGTARAGTTRRMAATPLTRARGERRSTHGWSTRGVPSPRTDGAPRGWNCGCPPPRPSCPPSAPWPVTWRSGWTTTSTPSRTCASRSTRPARRSARSRPATQPLTVIFETTRAGLHIEAWVPTAEGTEVPRDGFGWAILATLVDAVDARRSTQAEVPGRRTAATRRSASSPWTSTCPASIRPRSEAVQDRTSRWPGDPVPVHRRDPCRGGTAAGPAVRGEHRGRGRAERRPDEPAVRRDRRTPSGGRAADPAPRPTGGRRAGGRRRRRPSPTPRPSPTTGAGRSGPRRCSPSWRPWRRATRGASGCARSWSRSTCRSSGTSPAGSATAASRSTTCCRSAPSA